MKELFLFIIWRNAYNYRNEIIVDIKNNFNIRNIFQMKWSPVNWENNLSRFYGAKLDDIKAKINECGKEEFTLLVIEDKNPKYEKRITSRGDEIVNTNLFDKKSEYRKLVGGGYLIHATNTIKETNHDLTLLFGLNIEDFEKQYEPNEKIIEYNKDMFGCGNWNKVDDIFYALNNCCNYVVLRDFENNLDELNYDSNYDVDILCDDLLSTQRILNAEQEFFNDTFIYKTKLNDHNALFDIKYINDDYYCLPLELDILKYRKLHNNYYIPSEDFLYNSHLLHAIIHKNNYETEYNSRLAELYEQHNVNKDKQSRINDLSKWMISNNYYITIYKNNPKKTNVENIYLFDSSLYDSTIIKELEYSIRINELVKENLALKNELSVIKNTKGYKVLELMREYIIKIRSIIIK